jgi:hypothetical protein
MGQTASSFTRLGSKQSSADFFNPLLQALNKKRIKRMLNRFSMSFVDYLGTQVSNFLFYDDLENRKL